MTVRAWALSVVAAMVLAAPGLAPDLAFADAAAPAKPADKPPVEDTNTLHPDPAVIQGVLPNGLRYLIRQNATPQGAVSLRLAIDAGSFEEGPAEQGAAHFDEHLAFSAGDNEHAAGPEAAFARAGVAFGRDVNAETGAFATLYRLDLPKGDAAAMDMAFAWLRSVADGTRFTPAAVDRERSIVLAERTASLSPSAAAELAEQRFLAPGLRTTLETIGTPQSLAALNAQSLEGFYRRWYRPDNAVVVVVGDAPVETLRARVIQAFSSWTASGPAPMRPALGAPDPARGEAVLVQADPNLSSMIKACRVQAGPADRPDDVARLRERLLSQIWVRLVDDRLNQLTRAAKPPFLAAEVDTDTDLRELRATCLRVMPLDEAWAPALAAAQTELRRFEAHGPTQDELDELIDTLRAGVRGDADAAATRGSATLATNLAETALEHDLITSAAEQFWAFDAAVETITPQAVRDAFKRDWAGGGPLFAVTAPAPPTADQVRQAWDRLAAAPPPPLGERPKQSRWAYETFGRAGRVKQRLVLTNPDFVRLVFANGVVLNFKQTDFEKGDVRVRVRYGAGRREVPSQQYFAATFGAGLTPAGGLGRHDEAELEKLFAAVGWKVELAMGDDAFVLQGSTNGSSLLSELQILAAYVSDPGFRPELDSKIPTAISAMYRAYRTSPELAFETALNQAVAPGNPLTLPPEAQLGAVRMADIARLIKPALTEAPLEVTIVGDIDETTASALVGETLGALPPRADLPRARPDTYFLRFPDHDLPPVTASYDGPADKAMVGLVWPLYVAEPARRREEISLMLLAQVFDDALRHRVRQELGKTYAPQVSTSTPDHADQGYMVAAIETSPADVALVADETRRLARSLAAGEISDEALETARKPIVAALIAKRRSNAWWVASLDGSSRTDDGLEESRTVEPLMAAVTTAEVRQAAATWLKRAPITVTILPRAGAGAAGGR